MDLLSQKELIEKKRLEAIDEVVVTINHKINNPLMIIIGYAELLSNTTDNDDPQKLKQSLQRILKAALQIKNVTRQLSNLKRTATLPYLGKISMIRLPEEHL